MSIGKQFENGKLVSVKQLYSGDIGIVSGFSAANIGDVYGDNSNIQDAYSFSAPLLTVQVKPEDKKDYSSLVQAMKQLCATAQTIGFMLGLLHVFRTQLRAGLHTTQ